MNDNNPSVNAKQGLKHPKHPEKAKLKLAHWRCTRAELGKPMLEPKE